jgi:signal transduction histidine kinase
MPDRDLAGDDQIRRWHLLAQLTEALEAWEGEHQQLSDRVAQLIAEQVGDRTAVVLIDPPGHTRPVVSVAYRNGRSEGFAEALVQQLGEDGIREWIREFSDSDDRLEDSVLRPLDNPADESRHRQLLRAYMAESRNLDVITGPLRTLSGKIRGLIVCSRDVGSARFDAFDRALLLSATDAIGLGLDLAAAHAQARRAAAEAHIFHSLALSSPDFVAIVDNEGRVTFLNDAGRNLVGLPSDLDIGQTTARDYAGPAEPLGEDFNDWPQVTSPYWYGTSSLRDWRDDSEIPVSARSFWIHDHHSGERLGIATVQRDIRAEIAAQREIEALAEQRRVLLAQLVNAEQAERQRIAQEVHDEAMQWLAAGQLRLQMLANQIGAGDLATASRSAEDVSDLVGSAQARLRHLLLDLEPPSASTRELHDALVDATKKFFADTDTRVTVTGLLTGVPADVATVLYRVAREAVSNARRHANAGRVEVTLSEDERQWRLYVADDGVGLPEPLPASPGHLGISGMINRASAIGGTCTIRPGASGGTEVLIAIPK